jgi:rsbT co-antagonist protein RsbR
MANRIARTETLLTENARLRQRVTELEALVASPWQHKEALHQREACLRGVFEHLPLGLFVKDIHGRYLMVNHHSAAYLKLAPEQMIGKTDEDLFPTSMIERWRANDRPVLESGQPVQVEAVVHHEDGLRTLLITRFPLYDQDGTLYAIASISNDITERKRTEAAQAMLHLQILHAQKELLRELSTPLLPLARGVVVMPLIGAIDEERSRHILESLLKGVETHQARVAILDVTGVKTVDSQVARMLVQAAQAVTLLGARAVLTGVQPQTAMMMVQLGGDWEGIVTLGTLQDGIAYALRQV